MQGINANSNFTNLPTEEVKSKKKTKVIKRVPKKDQISKVKVGRVQNRRQVNMNINQPMK